MAAPLTAEMVQQILEHERYTLRFEDLCIALFREIQAIEYVSTSRTYDLGRDSRGTTSNPCLVPPIICCGTAGDVVSKAAADLTTLLNHIQPTQLLFCFTDPAFSEAKEAKIRADITSRCKDIQTVEIYGGTQLSELISHHPAAFEQHYAGELADIKSALAMPSTAGSGVQLTGLRLALTTQLHDDAQSSKADVIRNLLLTALSGGQALTPRRLAKACTDKLHLPRLVNDGWLMQHLNTLDQEGLIILKGQAYEITPAGKREVESRTVVGAKTLLTGQQDVREGLERLLGYSLANVEFRPIWNILESDICSMFISHGAQIIESLVSVEAGKSEVHDHDDLREQIHKVASRAVYLPGGGPRMAEIAQAIEDLFHERESAAFEWLTNIAEVFLHLCALGLAPQAQQELISQLREIDLILDTDMVLSLLSPGEPNHVAVKSLIESWHPVGGALFVPDSVLEEVAHHAWISQVDFDAVSDKLETFEQTDAIHLIENVFVRGFWHESREKSEKCTKRRWGHYIKAFKGSTNHDSRKVLRLLNDYDIEHLHESSDDDRRAQRVADALYKEHTKLGNVRARSLQGIREKCDRDGRMAALLVRRRKNLESEDRTAILISTSRALRAAVARIEGRKDDEEAVLYSSAVTWLLSNVPGVRLSAGSLRAVILDVDFPIRLHPIERQGLRLFHSSDEYKLHFSRRATLRDAVRRQVRKRAAEAGVSNEEIEERLFRSDSESVELGADILASAVDEFARSRSEEQIVKLTAENEQLRKELESERRRR